MGDRLKPGSPFLFCLIKTFNLAFGASALALFALSIWLWTQLGGFSLAEISFVILGLFQLALVGLAWNAKTSTPKLKCFMLLLALLFLVQLVAVILVFALGDQIIEEVASKADASAQFEKLKQYLNIVNYFVIGELAVEFFLIALVYCYIGSLRNSNNQYDYKLMDSEGNKITVQEKQLIDKQRIQQKYSKKRQQLQGKYPNYRPNN